MGQLISSSFLPETAISNFFSAAAGGHPLAVTAQTAGIVFVAELGDKSFFIAMVLASNPEFSKMIVFLGCLLALCINAGIASAIGFGLANALDTWILHVITATLFMGFSAKMYWDSKDASTETCESLDEAKDACRDASKRSVVSAAKLFFTAFMTNFVSEIGDKTQLAVLTQASKTQAVLNVLLGACLGFAAVTGLAVQCGALLSNYLTEKRILRAGAVLFFVFGMLSLWEVMEHEEGANVVMPGAVTA